MPVMKADADLRKLAKYFECAQHPDTVLKKLCELLPGEVLQKCLHDATVRERQKRAELPEYKFENVRFNGYYPNGYGATNVAVIDMELRLLTKEGVDRPYLSWLCTALADEIIAVLKDQHVIVKAYCGAFDAVAKRNVPK